MIMINLFLVLNNLLKSPELLFASVIIAIAAKFIFIRMVWPKQSSTSFYSWLFLLSTIIGSMFGDIAWVVKLSRQFFIPHLSYPVVVFIIRLSWCFLILQYQSFYLFITSLLEKQRTFSTIEKIIASISSIFSLFFLYLAFFHPYYLANEPERLAAQEVGGFLEYQVMQFSTFYILITLMIPTLWYAFSKIRSSTIPKIMRRQLKIFLYFFIVPYLFVESFLCVFFNSHDANLFGLYSISTLLLNIAIFYCLKQVMKLRFLNASDHVQSAPRLEVIDDFKVVLEQLSTTKSLNELSHITRTFFKEVFHLPNRSVNLTIRNWHESQHELEFDVARNDQVIEQFILTSDTTTLNYVREKKILIYDEIVFSNYFDEQETHATIISFLENINADIFIPIYVRHQIIGYISIARNAHEECYSQADRDAMLVFSNYLGNVINVLYNRNISSLLYKERSLKEELYLKHQEINQYRESIDTILRTQKNKSIGILFYKNNNFTFGNQAAYELISIDPNTQEGHPLTQTLKHVGQHVEHFNTPYTTFAKDQANRTLIISGVPHLQNKNVIITLLYPDISDIIARQINLLCNPNDWDYVLYLESTRAGQLVNQFIPGNTELLLEAKISLLKIALSKASIFLEAHEEDIAPITEIIHHISMGERLFTLPLNVPTKTEDIAPRLFGTTIPGESSYQPIFKLLSNNSTLLIKNINYLDLETQNHLAEYLQYGMYRPYKSEQQIQSGVRIICSSNQDLSKMVIDGTFNSQLYTLLKNNFILFPAISSLSENDLDVLLDGYTNQMITSFEFKNLFALNGKEKKRLLQSDIHSFHDLKNKLQASLLKKQKENQSTDTMDINLSQDQELAHAARLGKHALKDEKVMALLWKKLKNHNKIALFLGVNRSSVHRRFKAFNIGNEEGEIA